MSAQWCVLSLDRDAIGRPIKRRWCVLKRRVRGKQPRYRDHEETACCGMQITFPAGYEYREPTCEELLR